MRNALAIIAVLLAGCGGAEPTAQEEALNETARGPEQLAHPAPGDPQFGNNAVAAAPQGGERAGMPGATQGPTQIDSDAPHMGDQGSGTGGDTTR